MLLMFRCHYGVKRYLTANISMALQPSMNICSITVSRRVMTPFSLSLRSFSRYVQDFYSVIGVTKSASQAEIKREYFRKAKACHPDLNPNDELAVKKFQELANAYETLGNPQKRLEYDQMGYQQYSQHQQRQQRGQAAAPHADDVFRNVYQDFDIIKSAWFDYITETKEDFSYACKEADQSNWTPMYDIAKANSVFIVGIVVPIAVVLRMPAAVAMAMRFALPIVSAVGVGIIRSGQSEAFAMYLWQKLVEIALNRQKRGKKRR